MIQNLHFVLPNAHIWSIVVCHVCATHSKSVKQKYSLCHTHTAHAHITRSTCTFIHMQFMSSFGFGFSMRLNSHGPKSHMIPIGILRHVLTAWLFTRAFPETCILRGQSLLLWASPKSLGVCILCILSHRFSEAWLRGPLQLLGW
jgi:hypothetical protein